jgi:hypothetical protein
MTELAEPVAIGMVTSSDFSCPYDHDSPEPPDVHNDFIGDAAKLAVNMGAKHSTVLHEPFKPKDLLPVKSPNADPTHPFYDGRPEEDWPVVIPWEDPRTGEKGVHRYPVTCAAHHLIPAQESLKRATGLHPFMVKKNDSEAVAGGSISDGYVYSDLGYDVNGSENGIWLPGNYAVTALTMIDPHWTPAPSVLTDVDWEQGESPDNENVGLPKVISSPKLTGDRHQINLANRKWQYVSQAVEKGGQFHDRHADYSRWITSRLEEAATLLALLYSKAVLDGECTPCKERAKKFSMDEGSVGIPTPFGLLSRLNVMSRGTAPLLDGKQWRLPVVTSNWGTAYVLARRQLTLVGKT